MKRLLGGFLFTVLVAFSGDARAATIVPDCGTCSSHNTAWDLTLALVNDQQNIYQLTITATYGSPRDFEWVNAIAFKVDGFTNSYDGNPGVTVTGPAEASGWTIAPGGLSADGCNGSGNGFFCANSTLLGASPLIGGNTDIWTFLLDVDNGLPNFTSGTGSFKVHFTDALGEKVGSLVSEGVTFVTPIIQPPAITPEPATLLLFGTGLAAAATVLRRRKKS